MGAIHVHLGVNMIEPQCIVHALYSEHVDVLLHVDELQYACRRAPMSVDELLYRKRWLLSTDAYRFGSKEIGA